MRYLKISFYSGVVNFPLQTLCTPDKVAVESSHDGTGQLQVILRQLISRVHCL